MGTNPLLAPAYLSVEDTTRIYFPAEVWEPNYRLDYDSFNVPPLEPDLVWTPPLFLGDHIYDPFITDNSTASSSLFLLFNRISSITSTFQNDDPFFITLPNPSNATYNLYESAIPISTMACRERYELEIAPSDASVNDTWSVAGPWVHVVNMSITYGPLRQDIDLLSDLILFDFGIYPSALALVYGNLAEIINARKTLNGYVQSAGPQYVSTRTEVTRRFGVAILKLLNTANVLTGTDNDWGFGISLSEDSSYFCDKTLRISPSYVSVYLGALLLLFFGVVVIAVIAHWIDDLILLLSGRSRQKSTDDPLRALLDTQNLHRVLQLHRLFVEKTSEQTFKTPSGEIPVLEGPGSGTPPSYETKEHNGVGHKGDEGEESESSGLLPRKMPEDGDGEGDGGNGDAA